VAEAGRLWKAAITLKQKESMKALRYYGPGKAEIEDIPAPSLGSGEVLVSVRACGVCATDVKTFQRGHPKIPPGAVLGHETAGVIVATNGQPNFTTGDRVVIAPYTPCGRCAACRRRHFSLCENLFESSVDPGGFAEMLRVPKRIADQGLLHIPDGLDFVTASLTEPLACCLHGLEALHLGEGESLLIVGDGPMGLLQAAAGRVLGAKPIILSGMTPARLNHARQLADVVVDVSRFDLSAVVEATVPGGADKVMVSVGEVSVAQAALPLVHKGGAINLFAGMPANATLTLDANRIHYDEITVLGTFGFAPEHFRQALSWLASEQMTTSGLVTATVALADVEDALDSAARYEGIKTVVVMGERRDS